MRNSPWFVQYQSGMPVKDAEHLRAGDEVELVGIIQQQFSDPPGEAFNEVSG
jgi:hypothetical protein